MNRGVFAVSDVHGHVDVLRARLVELGLVDADGHWAGRDVTLWVLGDLVDRGPDGVGVLRLVRRLVDQTAEAPGSVHLLLGNHDVLALGVRTFGDAAVPHDGPVPRSFRRSWARNGGQQRDQDRLTDDDVAWLLAQPVMAMQDDWLLMHSDTTEYRYWGETIEEVNAGVRAALLSDDIERWWQVWRRLTTRSAFRGDVGVERAEAFLAQFGGRRIVHGHSVIGDWTGVPHAEVTEPLLYADGRVLAIDGGLDDGGPCLLTELAPVG